MQSIRRVTASQATVHKAGEITVVTVVRGMHAADSGHGIRRWRMLGTASTMAARRTLEMRRRAKCLLGGTSG